ncbi:MAG: hypothetical protein ACI9MC_003897 [Kiritimatiellia bacterium]
MRYALQTQAVNWNVYALFNHDLRQVFLGATQAPPEQVTVECSSTADDMVDWKRAHHDIEWIESVEVFPTLKHARMYAAWFRREGAFEGLENYVVGLDIGLA